MLLEAGANPNITEQTTGQGITVPLNRAVDKVKSSDSTIPYASLREWRDIILLLPSMGQK